MFGLEQYTLRAGEGMITSARGAIDASIQLDNREPRKRRLSAPEARLNEPK